MDETVEQLRAALATSEAARVAAEERARVLGEALRDCSVLLGWQEHAEGPGWHPLPLPLKRRVLALLASLPAAPARVTDDEDACEVCSRGPSDTVTLYGNKDHTVCAECAAREYLSPAAPADANPALVCLACNGAPERGGCGGCSGGECECQCRASAPAEVARVTPAVEATGTFTAPGRVVSGGIDPVTQCRRVVVEIEKGALVPSMEPGERVTVRKG